MIDTTTWLCGPPPSKGQRQRYPSRFMFNLKKTYPEFVTDDTLHMFSGSGVDFGTSTDIRGETGADIVAPFDAIPRSDSSFTNVLADPPYANYYQDEWGGTLPKPKHILREASRLVQSGGLIGVLHILVIPAYKIYDLERIAIHPVLCGPNNVMRAFNVYRYNG